MVDWLKEAKAVDTAIYRAIAATETPSFDVAMRRLSRVADQSKLWFATASAMALLGGSGGRLAARQGIVSLGIASGFTNLVAKPLTTRRRPSRKETEELARRHVQMPRVLAGAFIGVSAAELAARLLRTRSFDRLWTHPTFARCLRRWRTDPMGASYKRTRLLVTLGARGGLEVVDRRRHFADVTRQTDYVARAGRGGKRVDGLGQPRNR